MSNLETNFCHALIKDCYSVQVCFTCGLHPFSSSGRYMQKLSEATQQKLADANAVAEADASWVGIWDGQLQLDEIYDPRHPDV